VWRRVSAMTTAITLKDVTVHPVVEQQGPFFDALEFFPTLTKALLEENRSWREPTFIDPATGKLVLCVQSFVIKTPRHNILIDSCVGNHKPRPGRPFWNMLNSDRFEKGLAASGLRVDDIDYVMCTHLHVDHVGWNTRLENGRWVPTFHKAQYVMADRELAYWTQKEKEDPSGVPWITDSVLPAIRPRSCAWCTFRRPRPATCGAGATATNSSREREDPRGKAGADRCAAYSVHRRPRGRRGRAAAR